MLTKRENLIETLKGEKGNPDRFVNQYEPFSILYATPVTAQSPMPTYGGEPTVDAWGVTKFWPTGTPGAFPIHDEEHLVLKDMENWRSQVKAPRLEFSEEEWLPYIKMAEQVDRKETFATLFYAPGLFEQCHYLMNMQNCMIAFYEYPDEMHELIECTDALTHNLTHDRKCAERSGCETAPESRRNCGTNGAERSGKRSLDA